MIKFERMCGESDAELRAASLLVFSLTGLTIAMCLKLLMKRESRIVCYLCLVTRFFGSTAAL